jgi:hypothetical protein
MIEYLVEAVEAAEVTFSGLAARLTELTADPAACLANAAEYLQQPRTIERLRRDGRETSTHFVWLLARSPDGFGLYLHQYKHANLQYGYARTLHNHRYDFYTAVINGFYDEQSTAPINDVATLIKTAEQAPWVRHLPGVTRFVAAEDFHRLGAIAPDTVTVLAKAPPRFERSVSIDMLTAGVVTHVPVEACAATLGKHLSSLVKGASS